MLLLIAENPLYISGRSFKLKIIQAQTQLEREASRVKENIFCWFITS